ncbi:MAG: citrate/2-methylcitrate synthase, partial [Pseudomonadota bacterium]
LLLLLLLTMVPSFLSPSLLLLLQKLFPNVDFYSGIILSAIGFPTTMFTALFALARTVGWVAQYNEMIADPGQVIGRPRQLYTGPTQRDYIPLSNR